ncbi:MAG: HEAT repeat domain-containing protein [Pseudomonadota bacterium]
MSRDTLFSYPLFACLIICAFGCCILCASCNSKSENNIQDSESIQESLPKPASSSVRAKGFLDRFDVMLSEQKMEREEDEEQVRIEEEEKMLQLAIDQTLDELLTLDPKYDSTRIQELQTDLKNIGDKALEAVKLMLGEDLSKKQRLLLVKVLGAFKAENASVELYNQAMDTNDREVRSAALAKLKEAPANDALVQKTIERLDETKQGEETLTSIAVLGALGGEEAVGELQSILRTSSDSKIKKAAVDALGEMGTDSAKSLLYDVFDSDEEMRINAARALGKLKQEDVVIEFGEVILDPSSDVSMRAAAIEGLGQDNSILARRVLLGVLKDTKQPREIHQSAINMLVQGASQGSENEANVFVYLFENSPVEYLPQMLQPLLAKGEDSTAGLLSLRYAKLNHTKKIHALRTLGRIQTDRSFEILSDLMQKEKDAALRTEMLSAMRGFKGEKYTESVSELLSVIAKTTHDENERSVALSYLGELSPKEAVAIAEKNLYAGADKRMISTSIDILKRYGDAGDRYTLLLFKQQDTEGEFEKRIEDAIKVIDAKASQ